MNGSAIFSFVVAILAQIPFMNTELYVGPVAQSLGGADIAWIVGLIVLGVLYYVPMKKQLGK